jgi:hypothetical protein
VYPVAAIVVRPDPRAANVLTHGVANAGGVVAVAVLTLSAGVVDTAHVGHAEVVAIFVLPVWAGAAAIVILALGLEMARGDKLLFMVRAIAGDISLLRTGTIIPMAFDNPLLEPAIAASRGIT